MFILSIETSCDETAFSISRINPQKEDFKILSNQVLSQVKIHEKYGGVVPNLSAREHLKNFKPILDKTFKEARVEQNQLHGISVVNEPGLIPALLVGVSVAKTMSYYLNIPLIPINHLEAHLYSPWIKNNKLRDDIKFPLIALIASGGHTQLVFQKNHNNFKILGETVDDAAGEAFDKVSSMLNLGYPGGPIISKKANKGNKSYFDFPRPLTDKKNFNFSFSGLKTAVLYQSQKLKKNGEIKGKMINDICASFEEAVNETLQIKTKAAIEKYNPKSVLLAGGVAANSNLRKKIECLASEKKIKAFMPEIINTGDNAAMQAPFIYFKLKNKPIESYKNMWKEISANASN